MLDQDSVRGRTSVSCRVPGEPEAKPVRPGDSTGLKGFWRYMTTARPRNRWVALWRSSLPCAAGCPAPIEGLSYLELDADLVVRGTPEIFTCGACGKRFVLVSVTNH